MRKLLIALAAAFLVSAPSAYATVIDISGSYTASVTANGASGSSAKPMITNVTPIQSSICRSLWAGQQQGR